MLGLPPVAHWDGPLALLRQQSALALNGFSPHVVPRPPDWEPHVYVTGYWFLDAHADWQPPAKLEDFLQSGPPPVYVGFGSMSHGNPRAATQTVLQALRRAGQRGILLSGWGGLEESELPGSICLVDSVPHSWLFPRVAAVVHHGGAGTTAAGLRAGRPSVIVPFLSLDQSFWGWRVAGLGAGPAPVAARHLTADKLAEAITAAISDPQIGRAANELGMKIRAEDGVAQAIAILCDHVSKGKDHGKI